MIIAHHSRFSMYKYVIYLSMLYAVFIFSLHYQMGLTVHCSLLFYFFMCSTHARLHLRSFFSHSFILKKGNERSCALCVRAAQSISNIHIAIMILISVVMIITFCSNISLYIHCRYELYGAKGVCIYMLMRIHTHTGTDYIAYHDFMLVAIQITYICM